MGAATLECATAPSAVLGIELRLSKRRIRMSIEAQTLLVDVDPANVCSHLPGEKHSCSPAGVSCVVVVAGQTRGNVKKEVQNKEAKVGTVLTLR